MPSRCSPYAPGFVAVGLSRRRSYRLGGHPCVVDFIRTYSRLRLLLSLLDWQPGHSRMPFAQDLEPGPHKSVTGLAW
jgi:hypothetical protein